MSGRTTTIASHPSEPTARRSDGPRADFVAVDTPNVGRALPAIALLGGQCPPYVKDRNTASQIIIATINPAIGDTGVQTHTRTLHDGLMAAGYGCSVQTPFARPAKWLPVFALRKLLEPLNRSWSTRWYRHWHASALREALVRRLAQNGAATVLAQCPVSAGVALEVRDRLGLKFPIAMVCHFNFSEAKEYRDKGELPDDRGYQAVLDFEQRVLGSVDSVIYVSAWAKQIVEEERRISVRRSCVIWNGIASTPGMNAIPRSEMNLDPGDLVFINVGTLEKRKNQVGLIDLFAEIARERSEARLVLVGDGPHRAEVRRRIDEQNLASKVRMLGMRTDVPALLASADVYIHYAAMENCPVVLLEAARASLPIAAIPSGGVPELLDKLGGISLDSTNVTASREALRSIMNDAAARRAAGRAARTAFEEYFTRDAMVGAYVRAMQLPRTSLPTLDGDDGAGACRPGRAEGTSSDLRSDRSTALTEIRADTARLRNSQQSSGEGTLAHQPEVAS